MNPGFELEKKYISLGYNYIAGVDEVGRGALAGPLLACAVIIDQTNLNKLSEVNDSKKLPASKRKNLAEIIKLNCRDFAIGKVEAGEIDKMGIGPANILAFSRALQGLASVDFALIDGRQFRGFDYKYHCEIKGDSKSISIAAASIVAKVERDLLMSNLMEDDIYGFARHAGYGTANHFNQIKLHGPSMHHRRSFLRKFMRKFDKYIIM